MTDLLVIMGGLIVYVWFFNSKFTGKRTAGIVLSVIGFILLFNEYLSQRTIEKNYREYYGYGSYSMSPDAFLLMIFGAVVFVMGLLLIVKGWNEPKANQVRVNYDYYWKLEDEIFNQCIDKDTAYFNWKVWFDRRDEIIHTAPPEVLQYIDNEFRHCGCLQIYKINAIISNYMLRDDVDLFSTGIHKLRSEISREIYVNLPSMFSYKNGIYTPESCPKAVIEYRDILSGFFYDNGKAADKQAAQRLIELGRVITG